MFTGVLPAIVTPFKNGGLDEEGLRQLIEFHLENGVHGIVPCGTTGESATLSHDEHERVVEITVEQVNGRVPVVAGTGSNNTAEAVRLTAHAKKAGADGVLMISPYYNKPTQEGIYQHYAAIASLSELPVMLYNVPGRTGSNISAETALRLASDFQGTIIGVKEASGNFEQLMELINKRPDGFLAVSGDDAITLPLIAAGGDGAISVIGNAYPARISLMVAAALDGSYLKARELHYMLFPMMRAIFKEGNPTGIKAAMEIRGWIDNVLRLPLIPASSALYQEIARLDSQL